MWTDVLLILLGVVLTVGTAVFVTAEFSLVALDRASVERHAESGDKSASRVLAAMRTLSSQLSASQVGITLTTLLLGYTTQNALDDLFQEWLHDAGLALALSATIAALLAAVLVNLFSIIFGELVPKNLAMADPLKAAGLVVQPQRIFAIVFKPLIALLNGSANALLRLIHIEPQEEVSSARSAAELAALVRHSAEVGTMESDTATLFQKTIHMAELSAVDVMVDRGRVATLPADAVASDVVELAERTGYSRFPVTGEDDDEIIGIVSVRRAVGVSFEKRDDVPVRSSSLLGHAPQVIETLDLKRLLVQLRDDGLQMVIVLDEYGGFSGVVTLEDVLEEIVGEISDEHDQRQLDIVRSDDGTYLVPGRLRPDELFERTGVKIPEGDDYETLAGLVLSVLERMPVVGDSIESAGAILTVTRMTKRRVVQLKITPPAPRRDEEEDE